MLFYLRCVLIKEIIVVNIKMKRPPRKQVNVKDCKAVLSSPHCFLIQTEEESQQTWTVDQKKIKKNAINE